MERQSRIREAKRGRVGRREDQQVRLLRKHLVLLEAFQIWHIYLVWPFWIFIRLNAF